MISSHRSAARSSERSEGNGAQRACLAARRRSANVMPASMRGEFAGEAGNVSLKLLAPRDPKSEESH